jgi:hypothetical protein
VVVPCNRPYTRNPLDRRYIAKELGIEWHIITKRLHKLKRLADLRGDHSVIICLDDGEVYDAVTEDSIGNLNER